MKTIKQEEQLLQLSKECANYFERWNDLYENGGQDPFWEDGVNLNLTRNHILYTQNEMKRICGEIGYFMPEICTKEPPPVVDNKYIARKDFIFATARKVLAELQQNTDYLALAEINDKLTDEQKKKISYRTVVAYVSNLEQAIANEDYILMRRYLYTTRYNDSIKECLERARKIIGNAA